MRVRLSDPSLTGDLVGFFRRNAFLAVEESKDVVDVLPINSVSERADRVRITRYVHAWQADHPGVLVEIVDE